MLFASEAVADLTMSLNTWSTCTCLEPMQWRKVYPLVIRIAVKGGGRVGVLKVVFRIACVNDQILERDVVGSINIGARFLHSDGSPVTLGSTSTHEVSGEAGKPTPRYNPSSGDTIRGETLLPHLHLPCINVRS